jgi:3-methyl-2-oxobutanoate hydroxymethyltransferase
MDAVKLEGGRDRVPAIRNIVSAGIPVMGHLGLTPQSVHRLGGWKVQGKSTEAAKTLIEEGIRLAIKDGLLAIRDNGKPS